ncbi:fimbrial protein [Salmonella enterica subsp. enterica serovar Bonariensis]|nr:long polar fimbrial protein LpfA [Salmonella enterica]EDR6206931.1 fimbrial protein [Salmonella enterica subsp. enterica serovar Bonariensis]ELI2617748.1 fimbrial protein [Salmonella enterica]ELI2725962.1 fimbrial protein [Salmonella enterica]
MRNKITLAMALAGMMCGTSAFAADAGGGQIIFSGSVIDAPCSIVPESQNIQVNLGQVSAKSLKAAGATSSAVPIIINLTGCSFDTPPSGGGTNYSKVAVDFPGVPAPETSDGTLDNGEIKNMASNSPATKVAIQLLKSDASTPVKLDTPPANGDINLDTTSGNNQLKFFARMISVAGGATSGSVGATVTYKLKYF